MSLGMTETAHTYAIDARPDGSAYLLYLRSPSGDGGAIVATTWPDRREPRLFASSAEAEAFARDELGAHDEDFAAHPGQS